MSESDSLEIARRTALRGQTNDAILVIRHFADTGSDSAAASLAELCAFRGQWQEVILNAGRLLANPGAVYAGNVFDDMVRLIGRSGHETGQWKQIAELAVNARENIDRTIDRDHLRKRYFTILNALQEYAEREGAPPHERIAVFGISFRYTQEERNEAYHKAVENAIHNNPEFRQHPERLAAYLFAIARNSDQEDEVVRLYAAGQMPVNFDYAVYVAQLLSKRGEEDRAWEALWTYMAHWWPVDKAQVAPVVLLVDEHLRPLMTRERCEMVLALPRGPEADFQK